jgi:hypothetical protein
VPSIRQQSFVTVALHVLVHCCRGPDPARDCLAQDAVEPSAGAERPAFSTVLYLGGVWLEQTLTNIGHGARAYWLRAGRAQLNSSSNGTWCDYGLHFLGPCLHVALSYLASGTSSRDRGCNAHYGPIIPIYADHRCRAV